MGLESFKNVKVTKNKARLPLGIEIGTPIKDNSVKSLKIINIHAWWPSGSISRNLSSKWVYMRNKDIHWALFVVAKN